MNSELPLSDAGILPFVSDNTIKKPSSTVFNLALTWLGAVLVILLLSTAVVVIRKFKRDRPNIRNEDDHATLNEIVTGFARF